MGILKQINTVNAFSKILSLILFITLPFIGFALGIKYQNFTKINTKDSYLTSTKQNYRNQIIKKVVNDSQVITLVVYGKVQSLNITEPDIPYRYKIVLIDPISDKDAIADSSGLEEPKKEYIIVSMDEKIKTALSNLEGKLVEIKGELEWGYSETRHIKVDTVKEL